MPEVDDDSIDFGIAASGSHGLFSWPRVELQLKCTASPAGSQGLTFDLKIKNYNDLRAITQVARILVVVVVPPELSDWLTQTENELVLRKCALSAVARS